MPQLNDCRYDALIAQGFTGHTNDMLLAWAQSNGATSNQLNDALLETLIINGATSEALNDAWYEALGLLGIMGARNDRELAFWCDSGGIFTLTATKGFTDGINCDGSGNFPVIFNRAVMFNDYSGVTFAALARLGSEKLPDPTLNELCGVDSWTCTDGSSPTTIGSGIATIGNAGSIEVTNNKPIMDGTKTYTIEVECITPSGNNTDITIGGSILSLVLVAGTNIITGVTSTQVTGTGVFRLSNNFGAFIDLVISKFSLKEEIPERLSDAVVYVPVELSPDKDFTGACGDGTWTCTDGSSPTTITAGTASIGLTGDLEMSGSKPILDALKSYTVILEVIQITTGQSDVRLGGVPRLFMPVLGTNTLTGFTGTEIGAGIISITSNFGGDFVGFDITSFSIFEEIGLNTAINYPVTFTPGLSASDIIEYRYDNVTGNHTDSNALAMQDQSLITVNCLAPVYNSIHPNEVITYQQGVRFKKSVKSRSLGAVLPTITDFDSFTSNAGDHILFVYGAVNVESGNKLSSDLTSISTLPDLTTGKQFHVSSHSMVIGDTANNLRNNTGSNSGFEHFCTVGYFDRENAITRVCSSELDGGPNVFSGDNFGGIIRATTLIGTDANLGSFLNSLNLRGYEEITSTRIIIWPAGTAPPLEVIEDSMRNMWKEWVINNNPILDAQLFDY